MFSSIVVHYAIDICSNVICMGHHIKYYILTENIYLDESLVQHLVRKFELDDKFIGAENKRHLGALYNAIPSISKSIVELYAYGNQEVGEIKNILEVEQASVERVLKIVREKFRLI